MLTARIETLRCTVGELLRRTARPPTEIAPLWNVGVETEGSYWERRTVTCQVGGETYGFGIDLKLPQPPGVPLEVFRQQEELLVLESMLLMALVKAAKHFKVSVGPRGEERLVSVGEAACNVCALHR